MPHTPLGVLLPWLLFRLWRMWARLLQKTEAICDPSPDHAIPSKIWYSLGTSSHQKKQLLDPSSLYSTNMYESRMERVKNSEQNTVTYVRMCFKFLVRLLIISVTANFNIFFILCFFTFNVHTKVINCRRKESDKDTINSLKCWRTAVPSADSWRGRCKSQMRWSTQKLASQWKSCKMTHILSFLDRIAEGKRIEKLKWKNIRSRKLCYFIALIILFC